MHSRTFFFLCELTDISHCISLKAPVKVSYKATLISLSDGFLLGPQGLKDVVVGALSLSFPFSSKWPCVSQKY